MLSNIENEFGIKAVRDLENTKDIDCVIFTVAHSVFDNIKLDNLKKIMSSTPILIDVRGIFDKEEAQKKGFHYKSL